MSADEVLAQYDPATCADDPSYDTDFAFGWGCDSARYAETPEGDHGNFTTYAPEAVIKAFHPKTAAFTVIKDQLREAIGRLGTPRELHTAHVATCIMAES